VREPQVALSERIEQLATLPWRRLALRRTMHARGYSKVFGIGAARTGTSSLGRAFVLLGFRHTSWDPALWEAFERGDYEPIFAVAERFDSFEDGPWNGRDFYRELDGRFPGSKFVLTTRDPDSWLRSHERHFSAEGGRKIPERYRIADYAEQRDQILRDYQARNEEVRSYFSDRPADLLVLDIVGGEGWERLGPFLGLKAPGRPFPHLNAG
jgi:Sulfotransferase domain